MFWGGITSRATVRSGTFIPEMTGVFHELAGARNTYLSLLVIVQTADNVPFSKCLYLTLYGRDVKLRSSRAAVLHVSLLQHT